MNLIVAIGHIVGSLIALVALGVAVHYIGIWEAKRHHRIALEDAAVDLGVPTRELANPDVELKALQLWSKRYSVDGFGNKLSDFCGTLRTAWNWLGLLIEAAVLAATIWYTVTSSQANAVYAWSAVGVAIAFWIVSIAFSLIVRLLTGRYPGEAKGARRFLANAYRIRDLDERLAKLAAMTEQTCGLVEELQDREDSSLTQEEAEALVEMKSICEALSNGLERESPILERYFQNHIARLRYVLGETSAEDSPEKIIENTLSSLYSFMAVLHSDEPIAVMEKKLATGRGI